MIAPKTILIALVRVYQVLLSPVKNVLFGAGGCCRFSPTCSSYAIEALRVHGAFHGSVLSLRRILRCHPWGGAGLDPVPPLRTAHPSSARI